MGQPVVHFEIIGKDGDALRGYYSELFGWEFDADNPMKYGVVQREANMTSDGIGIGGGVASGPEGYAGHVTFYIQVPDVEAALAKAESLGGKRIMGPDKVMGELEIGQFSDPEATWSAWSTTHADSSFRNLARGDSVRPPLPTPQGTAPPAQACSNHREASRRSAQQGRQTLPADDAQSASGGSPL